MLNAIDITPRMTAAPGAKPDAAREAARARPATSVRHLAINDTLFQKGDTRAALYRVERGALCHYIQWDDGRHEVIEFVFPGDIIGFGYAETYVSTAQAVIETKVSRVSQAEFERELAADGQLASRLSVAADREFEIPTRTRPRNRPRHTRAAARGAADGTCRGQRLRGPRRRRDRR